MHRSHRLADRVRTASALVVLVLALVAVLPVVNDASEGRTHRAPVLFVGPEGVVGPLAEDLDALPDTPVSARATEDRDAAKTELREGRVVAVVVVDLSRTEDTLLLPAVRATALDDAVTRQVRATEARYGRTVGVERPGTARRAPAHDVLGWAATGAGFLLVLVVSLVWGPFARTLTRGLVRLAGLGALGVAAGALVLLAPGVSDAPGAGPAVAAVVVALGMFAAGCLTLALEALDGLAGLLVAAAVLLVLPAPLLVAGDLLLLPATWAEVLRWTPPGAVAEGLRAAVRGGSGEVRAVAVLAGVAALGSLVLALTRFDGLRTSPALSRRPGDAPTTVRWRVQLVGVLALLVVGATLVVRLVPGTETGTTYPSLASTTTCQPTGQVTSVADLNRITELRGSPAFQGGDVGAEALLQDGRRIWVFGDTLRSSGGGQGFVRNSMLVVGPGCLQVVVPASGGAIIPDRGDGVGYWPMSVVVSPRQGYDVATVTAQRVRTTDPGAAFGFANLGPAVATYVVPAGGVPQLIAARDLGPDSADTTRPVWGAATTLDAGWLYLWGTARPDDGAPTGFSLRVARVRPDDVLRQGRWRYWDGDAWVRDAGAATELVAASGGPSQTLSVFTRDGTWYAFSKRDEFLGTDLVFWTASSPTGPFTAQPPVAQLPSDAATGELRYMPLAHPDLLPQPGSMLVSYSRNSSDLGQVLADPLRYRPRFLRVPLP